MSEGNLRRAVQNLKKKAVMSQNAFFFKIIFFFFLSFFSWRNQFPSFKAPCQSNGLLFCNDKKIICSWNDFHSDQKRPTRSLNYICKLIKINIFWKSLLDTVHCAFQTFQIVKINQPFIF